MKDQSTQILAHLKAGKTITPLDALKKFYCLRLGARIHDLRARGHAIENVWHTTSDGKRVARYRLAN